MLSRRFLLLLAVFPVGGHASAQTITEIIDITGDGENAFFSSDLFGLASDAVGNVYAAGATSDNAFRIEPSGKISQVIDLTGDGAGNLLSFSRSLTVGRDGCVYIPGLTSDNVFEIDSTGAITEIIDATGDGRGHLFESPYAIAADGAGNVYVPAALTNNVFKIDPLGVITVILDETGDGSGNVLSTPFGIAASNDGTVYVTAITSDNVFEVAGNVYVGGRDSRNVFEISSAGEITEILDEDGDGQGQVLEEPVGIACDAMGRVYVSDRAGDRVFRVEATGVISVIIDGSDGGPDPAVEMPAGLTVDACGNLYVAGSASANVVRVEVPAAEPDFHLGQRLTGGLEPDDTDDFSFYATAGTLLTITAKRKGKGSVLIPTFAVLEPNGDELGVAVPAGKSARVKKLEVQTTGLHRVSVSSLSGAGQYVVKTKARFPKSVETIVEVGSGGATVDFDGMPGMTIKRLRVKALAPKGEYATVDGVPADLAPQVALLSAAGAPIELPPLKTAASGKKTGGKNVAEITRAGPHFLTIEGGETVGYAKVVLKLKVAKGKGEVGESGAVFLK